MKIFRRKRLESMKTNSSNTDRSSYVKYALGEIALVVLGILIALQINNWNERRKARTFEKEILQQIRANLIKDKITLDEIHQNFLESVSSSNKILNSSWEQQEIDSLKYWLGDIVQFDRFMPLTNAYEVLKSKGLETITNKQLRFMLGAYYDDESLRVRESIQDIETSFNSDWMPIMREIGEEFRFKQYLIVSDPRGFQKGNKPNRILRLNQDNFASSADKIAKILVTIDRIQEMINEELN